MKSDSSIVFQKQFSGLSKVIKSKTLDNTVRQYKSIQSLISLKKNNALGQIGIIPIRSALDSLKNVTYTLDLPKYTTLKQFLIQNPEGLTQDLIKKIIQTLIKVIKFISVVVVNFVSISTSKILLSNDKILFCMFSLEDQQIVYDPEHAGVSLPNSHVWSIAFIMDQLYRKQLRNGEFTPIPNLHNPRINEFLNQVFVKNRSFGLDEIQSFLNPTRVLMCPEHKDPIIKANIKDKKLYCSKCLDYEFYNVQLQQNRCCNKMDELIQLFKNVDQKFEVLIKLTKGQDVVDSKTLKKITQQISKQFKDEYKSYIDKIDRVSLSPIQQKQQLNKLVTQIDSYKDELVSKYQQKMRKELLQQFKKQLDA